MSFHCFFFVEDIDLKLVHGYSLLRTQLNKEYFNDLFDESLKFEIDVEGHRMCICGCNT